jgi:hypothetical protein
MSTKPKKFPPDCQLPAISLHSYTVPLVQWSTRLLPVMRDLGSIPNEGTCVEPGFSCSHYLAPRSCFFTPGSKISILLYVVDKIMQKVTRFNGKTARYYVLKMKFVDKSHH